MHIQAHILYAHSAENMVLLCESLCDFPSISDPAYCFFVVVDFLFMDLKTNRDKFLYGHI